MKNRRAFALMELMTVVGILIVIASLAIPGLLRHKLSANETAAQEQALALATDFEYYAVGKDGKYPGPDIQPIIGESIRDALPSCTYGDTTTCLVGPVKGYNYTVQSSVSSYLITAEPANPGLSGNRKFYASTGGYVRESSGGGGPDDPYGQGDPGSGPLTGPIIPDAPPCGPECQLPPDGGN